ncbi:MAG: glycosyltransferase family 4 protein [Thermofilaceae archaeon]
MNVLFVAEIVSTRTGAERAIHGTMSGLQKQGISVMLYDPTRLEPPELEKTNVVHWFGTGSELEASLQFLRGIMKKDIPIVATTTLWPITPDVVGAAFESELTNPGEIAFLMDNIRRLQFRQALILSTAHVSIATSETHAERANQALKELGFHEIDFEIVPNAVNKEEIATFPIIPWEERPLFISCLARIEHWKNQARLLKAAMAVRKLHPNLRMVLAGRALIQLDLPQWCDYVPESSPFTAMALASLSRVHALPSLGDFPGLANLEAAALGCQIVASEPKFSTIHDYIPDVITVDPRNVASIAFGLREALTTKPNPAWRDLVLSNFNYDVVATKLIEIYKRLV